MTVIHTDELRDMTPAERANELGQLKTELLNDRAVMAAGGAPENPGRIGELRKAIARVKTIQREEGDDIEVDASEFAGDVGTSEPDESAEAETEDDEDEAQADDETDDADATEADADEDEADEDEANEDSAEAESDDGGDDAGEDE